MHDSYAEDIELVDRTKKSFDPSSSQPPLPRVSAESSISLTSVVFGEIQKINQLPHPDEDVFLADSLYQDEFTRYSKAAHPTKWSRLLRSIPGQGKSITWLCGAILIGLWVIGLLVYTQSKALSAVIPLVLKTNISISGLNVTLAPYSHEAANFTILEWRKGVLATSKRHVLWLDTPQYPADGNGGGYYQAETVADACVILQIGTEFRHPVITGYHVDFESKQHLIELVTVNPALAFDNVNGYDIVKTNTTSQFRSLGYSLYWLYDRERAQYSAIGPNTTSNQLTKLLFAKFSPKGDFVTFGYNHDLYLYNLETREVLQITDTGSVDIFNGIPDWVYGEEVMRSDTMLWWSPDQENLVFASINDTSVGSVDLNLIVKPSSENDEQTQNLDSGINQYPIRSSIKYPKTGTNNPILTLFRYSMLERAVRPIEMSQRQQLGDDFILYDAIWIDNDSFVVKESDRTSTVLVKGVYDPNQHDKGILSVSSFNALQEFGGWVDTAQPVQIIPREGANLYIDRVVINGRSHLAVFENARSSLYQMLLTNSSQWDIQEHSPLAYDVAEGFIFTLATIRSSMDAHLIGVDLRNSTVAVHEITSVENDGLYEINFSPNGQYLDLIYSGPLQPWQKLINVGELHDLLRESATTEQLDTLIMLHKSINNFEQARDIRKQYNLPTKIFKTVSIVKDAVSLNVIEILPPNFDPTRKKYPLLVSSYGGPGFQNIYKKDDYGFHEMISGSLDAIVLVVDPRGTGGQGWPYKTYAKDKIGYWEARDIVTVVGDYVAVNHKSVDVNRVALWGWSYGGFTTLKTLEYDGGEVIKYGIAVAPVTNWLFYDSIYTERYMGLPQENPNYDKLAKILEYDNFKGVSRFLIMHGTADDNVHIQNLLWLLDQFDMTGVENYDVHFFPDSDHSIQYHNASSILFDKLYRWLDDAFSGKFDNL